jgi:hypothetical protein
MTFSIMALSKKTFSITKIAILRRTILSLKTLDKEFQLGATTLNITAPSIMTCGIMALGITTLSKKLMKRDSQHNDTQHNGS